MSTNPTAPATMPTDAIGFLAIAPVPRGSRRNAVVALYRPDGTVGAYYGQTDTIQSVAAVLAGAGLRVLADGSVVR